MKIEFRPIDRTNYNECIELSVNENQKRFVAPNQFSLVQAAYESNLYPLAIYNESQMILKVKEPLKNEYSLIRENQIVFTFFHFAASLELTTAMVNQKCICIAYETIEDENNSSIRLVTSWATSKEAVLGFIEDLKI